MSHESFIIIGSVWVLESFRKFGKVMEIDNAIFQDLESFRKRETFQNCYVKFLDFCLGNF